MAKKAAGEKINRVSPGVDMTEIEVGGTNYSKIHGCNVKILGRADGTSYNCRLIRGNNKEVAIIRSKDLATKKKL